MNPDKEVTSPITGSTSVSFVKGYDVRRICARYAADCAYDVSSLFHGLGEVGLYRCDDTGYLFFYPFVEGDSQFYARLQQKPTYYMPWKYEHEEAVKKLADGMRVLEVGCAKGDFLQGLGQRLQVSAVGLELNESAARLAREKGVRVLVQPLAEHAADPANQYDAICMFQVLEHIAEVRQTLDAALSCLAPNGLLVISVPDNDSFVGVLDPLSDQPPHHVGRWCEASLQAVAGVLGLEVAHVAREPLQDYHRSTISNLVKRSLFGENRVLGKLLRLAGCDWLIGRTVACLARWISGHTILVVLKKRQESP